MNGIEKSNLTNSLSIRRLGKISTLVVALCISIAFVLALIGLTPGARLLESAKGGFQKGENEEPPLPSPTPSEDEDEAPKGPQPLIDRCGKHRTIGSPEAWRQAQARALDLRDDKFTIAMQTYNRPKELNDTLSILLREEIPSLLDIVVVWNNLDQKPPADFISTHGVNVRYRASPVNSLNERLRPDEYYRTQGVLLTDDDVYYHPDDLEFVFQTWRKFGRNGLAGGLPRCAKVNDEGEWRYNWCNNKDSPDKVYSMIITNLAFSHISFLDYYSSDDPTMTRIRGYVDEHTNCEDIAMNYMTAMLTGEPPLLVRGHKDYHNADPSEGISRKKGHMDARHQCLNDFSDFFGCQPLVETELRVDRGVVPRRG